jgi:hypothetical protein
MVYLESVARGRLRLSLAACFAAVLIGRSAVARPSIEPASYEDRAQYRIKTSNAEFYFDRAGGGFSRMVDRDGRDWIAFRKNPLKQSPASAAAGFRGSPNLVYGAGNPDAGAGHPGFDRCSSVQVDAATIRTESLSGNWAWSWTFQPGFALLTVEKVDAVWPYWFLFEGPVAGRWHPAKHYWGTDRGGPRRDLPDQRRQEFGSWRWAYFGDDESPRVVLVVQIEPDEVQDTVWFMGNTKDGLASPDGMLVFGFGRGPGAKPLLRRAGARFAMGFVETNIAHDAAHEAVASVAAQWIAAARSQPKAIP